MAKAGRKRRANVKREPNGKPSRQGHRVAAEQSAMQAAIEYRQSVFGLSPKDVLDQKAATAHGRLCLQGVLSEQQWQAAEDWAALVNAHYAAINAPRGFRTASARSLEELSEDEHAARCLSAKIKLDKANAAIKDYAPAAIEKERFLALRTVVLEGGYDPSIEGPLRVALNSLVKHFGLEGRKAA